MRGGHLDRLGEAVDILFEVIWSVEVEPEVDQWIESLSVREADRSLDDIPQAEAERAGRGPARSPGDVTVHR